MVHSRLVACHRRDPSPERTRLAQCVELPERAEEHLLHEVLDVVTLRAGEEHSVHEPPEALVQDAERDAVAIARREHERRRVGRLYENGRLSFAHRQNRMVIGCPHAGRC